MNMKARKFITGSVMFFFGMMIAVGFSATAGQSPLGVNNAINTSGYYAPEQLDQNNNVKVNGDGWYSALNVTSSSVLKTSSGGVVRIIVNSAPAATGGIYDSATLGGANASTLIYTLPAAAGIYYLNFPTFNGLVVNPGQSGVVSVSYE